jgi:hypothetical protein
LTTGLLHSFPEKHCFIGVVARKGHQEQADVVRFRFFLAVVSLAPDHPESFMVHFLAGDALAGVMGQGVRCLMGNHGRQLVVVLHHSKKATEDSYLAAGQTESIDLVIVQDICFPFKPVAFSAG